MRLLGVADEGGSVLAMKELNEEHQNEGSHWRDGFADSELHEFVGLCPALYVPKPDGQPEQTLYFGPFGFTSMELAATVDREAERMRSVSEQYEGVQGISSARMLVVYLRKACIPLAGTLWPIVVLAFTGWARRRNYGPPGAGRIPSPSSFLMPYVLNTFDGNGFTYLSEYGSGFGDAEHVPISLRVERVLPMQGEHFNRALACVCEAVGREPSNYEGCSRLRALGAAAEFANKSVEYRVHRIVVEAQRTKMYTLLLSAYESLARVSKPKGHNYSREVAMGFAAGIQTRSPDLCRERYGLGG